MNCYYNQTLNRLYDSIVWTHKIQRTYLEVLESRRKIMSIIKIILISFSSISTTVFAIFSCPTFTIISSFITLISLVISNVLDKVETKENIEKLNRSSNKLFKLRNELMLLSDEIKSNIISNDLIKVKIEFYNQCYSDVLVDVPTIPNSCVAKAGKKLKTRNDEELDFKVI